MNTIISFYSALLVVFLGSVFEEPPFHTLLCYGFKRLSEACYVKVCTCSYVQPEDGPDKIHAEDRQTVKRTIVELMLKSPEQIQKQVCDSDLSECSILCKLS